MRLQRGQDRTNRTAGRRIADERVEQRNGGLLPTDDLHRPDQVRGRPHRARDSQRTRQRQRRREYRCISRATGRACIIRTRCRLRKSGADADSSTAKNYEGHTSSYRVTVILANTTLYDVTPACRAINSR